VLQLWWHVFIASGPYRLGGATLQVVAMDISSIQSAVESVEAAVGAPPGALLAVAAGAGVAMAAVALLAPADGSVSAMASIIAARERRDRGLERDTAAVERVKERLQAEKAWPASVLLRKSATELAGMIKSGSITSEACVAFYCDRVIQVNPAINAVTESRFTDALDEARKIDRAIRKGATDLP
jgi:hypothetical protein